MIIKQYQVVEINHTTGKETVLKRVPSKRTAESVMLRRKNANYTAGRKDREIAIRPVDVEI